MKRMVIVGTVRNQYDKNKVRLYRLDTREVKDIKDSDLAPVAERLGVINFEDLQIPEVRGLYPAYFQSGITRLERGGDACYVLGKFGGGGYVCIRPHLAANYIQVIPRSRLVADVKKGTMVLLNAMIERGEKYDTVATITGEDWDDMSYLKGRALKDCEETNEDDCAHEHEVTDKIGAKESVESHDELGMLSGEQKEFLKNYYIDYSIDTFNKLVGKTSWKLKAEHEIAERNKKRLESKLAKLAELRAVSGGDDWCFAGVWDVGYVSSKPEHKCEFGHKLRYIYRARPVNLSLSEAEKEGKLLQFGIVCHADFLNIPKEEVKRLEKLLDTMSSEIRFISTVVANKALDMHNELMSSMLSLLKKLKEQGMLAKVLGKRLAIAYEGFVVNNIPLVESFVLDVMQKIEEYGVLPTLKAVGYDMSLFAPKGTEAYTLPVLAADATELDRQRYASDVSYQHRLGLNELYRTYDSYGVVLTTYAEKLLTNDIAGEYMYNPVSVITDYVKGKNTTYQRYGSDENVPKCESELKKYKYGYNDLTRELRTRWLLYFDHNNCQSEYLTAVDGSQVKCLTLHGLDTLITLVSRIQKVTKNVEQYVSSKVLQNKEVLYALLKGVANGSEYKDSSLVLLLFALPYAFKTGYDTQLRRSGYTVLARKTEQRMSVSVQLFALLDAVQDGAEAGFIEQVKGLLSESYVSFNELPVAATQETQVSLRKRCSEIKDGVYAIISAANRCMSIDAKTETKVNELKGLLLQWITEVNARMEEVSVLYRKIGNSDSELLSLQKYLVSCKEVLTKDLDEMNSKLAKFSNESESKNKQSRSRGSVSEAKKLVKEFMSYYKKLEKDVEGDATIKIAKDIINRFQTKLKEQQGFTERETWRIKHELDRLKRLAKNN